MSRADELFRMIMQVIEGYTQEEVADALANAGACFIVNALQEPAQQMGGAIEILDRTIAAISKNTGVNMEVDLTTVEDRSCDG